MQQESGDHLDVVYGINSVREAISSRAVDFVMITQGYHNPRLQEIIDGCRAAGISLRFSPRIAVERAAGTPQHQNVVAVCTPKAYDDVADLVAQAEHPLLVALDGVEDPANLGAVIRTVVATGARGIIIPERRAAGLSPAVARAAAGAMEHVKVARVTNLVRTLADLKSQNLWVYGFESDAPKSYTELDYSQGCVLVMGGEGHGLHRLVREACDERAHIPLLGPVSSLNVSVAAGVVLYEAVRQRGRVKQ
ncbi:MAG: 23S rRNA (guanosine(2251)-2'-O)-methyltransferase RlmB [Acidobacteriota bacterium]|nr:23S rRNA (guanosine(2251)-2'-O)-methyltransferase RlmB [Acidobacteriota bacterium]